MGAPFPGPWSFKKFPFLREIHDCNSELIVSRKAAQLGLTETALNKTFFTIDILGRDVLYLLPNKSPDAADFSNARFGPALELSEHLRELFIETDNQGHKRAGSANLYVRGSKSKAGLRSIPVSLIVLDEVDVMAQENIPLAMERASGQVHKQVFMLSTPTVEGMGIDLYFQNSTQELFEFPCPGCSKYISLGINNLKVIGEDPTAKEVQDSYLFCHLCQKKLEHNEKEYFLSKGVWVTQRESDVRGFSVNQLYSPALKPSALAISFLRAKSNPFDETEFYNSKLGLPHTVEGSRVTDKHILECTGTYKQLSPQEIPSKHRFITLGCDVGKFLHIEIAEWYFDNSCTNAMQATPKVIAIIKTPDFGMLDVLMRDYQVRAAVIDLNPERRKVREFCERFPGIAYGCEYVSSIRAREIIVNEAEYSIQVDRTSWLDLSLTRFQRKGIVIPVDTSLEYKAHLKAQVRVYAKDKEGNPIAKYVTGSQEDHYGHARNYNEIAFSQAVKFGVGNKTIRSPW
jgi:hypothetical protein